MNGPRDMKNLANAARNPTERPSTGNTGKVDLLDIKRNPERKEPKFGIDLTPQKTKRTTPQAATMKRMSEEFNDLRGYQGTLKRLKLAMFVLSALFLLLFILVCISLSWARSIPPTGQASASVAVSAASEGPAEKAPTAEKSSDKEQRGKTTPYPTKSTPAATVRERHVVAHLLFNSTKFAKDKVKVQRKEVDSGMRNCEKGYDLRQWISTGDSALLMGLGFNNTSGRLRIQETAFYSIYSQVMFRKIVGSTGRGQTHAGTFFHVICKATPAALNRKDRDLLLAMTPNQMACGVDDRECRESSFSLDTNYVSGVVRLAEGDEVYVKVSDLELVHKTGTPRETFFGLFKVSNL